MSGQPDDQPRSIRRTNALIRALVEQETLESPFWVGGIVTRTFLSDRGHLYFDLQDDDYSLNCFVRELVRGTLDFTISDGMEVEVFGAVRVYERLARVQIEVEQVKLVERPVFVVDEKIQEQLEKKGLWPRAKRSLPEPIKRIGLITSRHSDARNDFYDTYQKENGRAEIKLIDVRLQGQQAPQEIADAINRLNKEGLVDAITIVRGGGRTADLAVFNDYLIAEAICRSNIPVVTGIGHQLDETFADQVADYSAITPTAAASLLARGGLENRTTQVEPALSRLYLGLLVAIVVIMIALLLAMLAVNNVP